MRLALFDIDDTLIRCDSEFRWCEFLTRSGLCDMSGIDRFCRDYEAGELNFDEFAHFQLSPLTLFETAEIEAHRDRFLAQEILPQICATVQERVAEHRARGDQILAVSAAHDFLAAPIARMAGIEEGLYTMAEHDGTRYTGSVAGTPCFRQGKCAHVDAWLAERGVEWSQLETSWFYSDSHNDLPLLRRVEHPVVVRPDEVLREVARAENWEVLG